MGTHLCIVHLAAKLKQQPELQSIIETRFFNLVDLQDLEFNLGILKPKIQFPTPSIETFHVRIVKASKSEEPAPPLQPYSTKLKPDEIWHDPP